mmetsp:Transcript_66913/g.159642  ORF Transcript_66913/g.159642 Transcript_66913/m.159642 type:complete len:220 (-) Transcript_66913:165-824(-)
MEARPLQRPTLFFRAHERPGAPGGQGHGVAGDVERKGDADERLPRADVAVPHPHPVRVESPPLLSTGRVAACASCSELPVGNEFLARDAPHCDPRGRVQPRRAREARRLIPQDHFRLDTVDLRERAEAISVEACGAEAAIVAHASSWRGHSGWTAEASWLVRRARCRESRHLFSLSPGCRASIPGDGIRIDGNVGDVLERREAEEERRLALERRLDEED